MPLVTTVMIRLSASCGYLSLHPLLDSCLQYLPASVVSLQQQQDSRVQVAVRGLALFAGGAVALYGLSDTAEADEAEHGLHAPAYPWPHSGFFNSYDHAR